MSSGTADAGTLGTWGPNTATKPSRTACLEPGDPAGVGAGPLRHPGAAKGVEEPPAPVVEHHVGDRVDGLRVRGDLHPAQRVRGQRPERQDQVLHGYAVGV